MQSMKLWLVSKRNTFKNNFYVQAQFEPALHSCVCNLCTKSAWWHLLLQVAKAQWTLVLLMRNPVVQLATQWLPTDVEGMKEDV